MRLLINMILLCLISVGSLQALPQDSKQKLKILADASALNFKTGENYYLGHVRIDQGSSHLLADRVVTQSNHQHQLVLAKAYGRELRAHYWTTPSEGDKLLDAFADTIQFSPPDQTVILTGNALVSQDKNSFRGESIIYHILDQTVSAPKNTRGQSTIVIEPQSLS